MKFYGIERRTYGTAHAMQAGLSPVSTKMLNFIPMGYGTAERIISFLSRDPLEDDVIIEVEGKPDEPRYMIVRHFYRTKADIESGFFHRVHRHEFLPMTMEEAKTVKSKLNPPLDAIDHIMAYTHAS